MAEVARDGEGGSRALRAASIWRCAWCSSPRLQSALPSQLRSPTSRAISTARLVMGLGLRHATLVREQQAEIAELPPSQRRSPAAGVAAPPRSGGAPPAARRGSRAGAERVERSHSSPLASRRATAAQRTLQCGLNGRGLLVWPSCARAQPSPCSAGPSHSRSPAPRAFVQPPGYRRRASPSPTARLQRLAADALDPRRRARPSRGIASTACASSTPTSNGPRSRSAAQAPFERADGRRGIAAAAARRQAATRLSSSTQPRQSPASRRARREPGAVARLGRGARARAAARDSARGPQVLGGVLLHAAEQAEAVIGRVRGRTTCRPATAAASTRPAPARASPTGRAPLRPPRA